ncbi:MAG: transketolase [Thermodesulfobacteriota bacterium]|nr:transketolase [Thermodesulfobacteriota bacterium]
MITEEKIKELKHIARLLRIDVLKMLNRVGSGHTGGSLSSIEIIVSLYFHYMKHNPEDPLWADRDKFVLSKGHAAPALYAALARCGYFALSDLMTLRSMGSKLQGHPDMKVTPGVEVSTGSLGQGLSLANGLALASRLDKRRAKVYIILGDGEVQEGQVWEAAMSSAHFRLDNLCAVLDFNGLQIDGKVKDIMNIDPISDKWKAFGWEATVIDGHNFSEILKAFTWAEGVKGKPSIIIAKTIKGKGVSIFENNVKYHGVPPTDEELTFALEELSVTESEKN